jgi:hypothetical protein
MKIIFLGFLILLGCSIPQANTNLDSIIVLQSVWESKDPLLALRKIQGLRKIEDEKGFEILSDGEKVTIFSLAIYVSKLNKKIASVAAPLNRGEEVPSHLVKEMLKADDWKIYEHPVRGTDYLQSDLTEYSEKLGVGFAYDKHDKEKKIRMIYWGYKPENIQTLL